MSDALQHLIEESEQPLTGYAASIVAGLQARTIKLTSARAVVPNDALNQDKVTFVLETSHGRAEVPYSPRFNAALIELGIAMNDPEAEAIRMGKLLLDNLRYPDAQFGKHYTDAVLWQVIDERFGRVDPIRQALDELTHYQPSGDSRYACEHYLRHSIDGAGNQIVRGLKWRDPQASSILAAAVYYVLDQRNHISARRILFPQHERSGRMISSAATEDRAARMIAGLWVGPREDIPTKPDLYPSAVLPRLGVTLGAEEVLCLDLVRVETIDPPNGWAWLVLSEAGIYTYTHTIGLNNGERWRFVHWDDNRPISYEATYHERLTPNEIARLYGRDAFDRSRQDRDAIQLRLLRENK